MTKSPLGISAARCATLALSLVLLPLTAQAQNENATPPPATVSHSSSSGAGLGVGAAAFLGGLTGLDVVYDVSRFHVEGVLGFSSVETGAASNATSFQFGARGWYHLHQGVNSDFSLGGGFGMRTRSGGGNPSATATLIEPGMQARVFFTPNFTLNMTAGFSFVFGDGVAGVGGTDTDVGFGLGAQLLGGIGFTYFFR